VPVLLQALALVLGVAVPLLVLAVTAHVLGRTLAGELGSGVERWAIQTALGLAALAHLGFLLGLAGLLRPAVVLLAVAGIHLAGFRAWRGLREAWQAGRLRRPSGRYASLAAVAFLPLAVLTLYPPTAFDATMYHLPFVRGFMASGGLPFLPDLRFPVFPQANEMLFALVLFFAPDVAAHGIEWLMAMLTAALLWRWGRDAFPGTAAGWLAPAIYLGNPLVIYLASTGYIEAGLALFATAALYAARRWRAAGERRWLVLAAVFAATAADSKYLGLFFVGAVGLAVLFGRRPEREHGWRARGAGVLLFAGVAAALLLPWYGRIFAWTGNPFFPFFPRLFGSSLWAPVLFEGFLPRGGAEAGAAARAAGHLLSRGIELLRLPWDVVFERGRYNGQPPYSPLYLAVLPFALLAAWRDARHRHLLAIAAAYAFCCLSLPRDARYLIPAVPLVSLSAAGVLAALLGRLPDRKRLLAAALCAGCFLPGWLYVFYRFHRLGPLPWTAAERESFLGRQQPYYPAVAYLNRTRGSEYTLWALHAESMPYYAEGRFLGDWVGPASFERVIAGVRGPGELHGRLRRLGAGYLLIPVRTNDLPFPEDAAWQPWFQPVYADSRARVYRLR
jgi:uncharacterized membrane protein YhaH (DUF805 family)